MGLFANLVLVCLFTSGQAAKCTGDDATALAADCDCALAGDCKKDQFCWVDKTCDDAAKAADCTFDDATALGADCKCDTTSCKKDQFCWVDKTCKDAAKAFNCKLYADTCSGVTGYEAYTNCAATIAGSDMTCRTTHLALAAAANGADAHCKHASPMGDTVCNSEPLTAFSCTTYESTCKGVTGYKAYTNCASTIANNDAQGMACRTQHLALAAATGADNAATHCKHAQFAAEAPCATEMLKTFDCALYASTCKGVTGYEAYANCDGTKAANMGGMECRIQHLALAAATGATNPGTHCTHAAPTATAPCATETLMAAASMETSSAMSSCGMMMAIMLSLSSALFA